MVFGHVHEILVSPPGQHYVVAFVAPEVVVEQSGEVQYHQQGCVNEQYGRPVDVFRDTGIHPSLDPHNAIGNP